jgi:hypothetical protein
MDDPIMQKIHDTLKRVYFSAPDDLVDVSPGDGDCVHVVIVSRKMEGARFREKLDLISSLLMNNLPKEEWSRVSLTVWRSPEEIKAFA